MKQIFVASVLLYWQLGLCGCNEWNIISQTRTTYLEIYRNYIDAVIMHFDIPEDSVDAKFEFRGSTSASVFGCPAADVELFLQYGAPPVINPDKSKFPSSFLLNRREEMFNITFKTNKLYNYINISTPMPGSYYAAVYHPYGNPKDQGITQDGLFPICNSFVDATLFVKQLNLTWIVSDQKFGANLKPKESKLFKVYAPSNVFKVILVGDLTLCDGCDYLNIFVYPSSTYRAMEKDKLIGGNVTASFRILGDNDYFVKVVSNTTSPLQTKSILNFNLKFVETPYEDDEEEERKQSAQQDPLQKEKQKAINEMFNMNVSHIYYTSPSCPVAWKYDEFELHKSLNTESFQYTYELDQLEDGSVPININISSVGFSALKFNVRDVLDVGGTLNIALAFLPKIEQKGRWIYIKKEPANHTVVACLRRAGIEVPVWQGKCMFLEQMTESPLILNSSVTNASVMIPYPEPGNWYLTFKLFCGSCEACNCPEHCGAALENCINSCETVCDDYCFECQKKCERKVVRGKEDCKGCDCDGNCIREGTGHEGKCNSSIIFDVSSYPCVGNKCGLNGKCSFGVAEGFIYSTCVCTNNFQGWDCQDASNANSLFEIWLELLLLVFSNFAFLITVYVACKREYYVEALTYAAILFSSTFYHACDAGEHRINFCLVALHVLQFCDFYCAILAIWVTLIAMAYLPQPMSHLLHVSGAIFLGAAVTLNKTSLWVFVSPVTVGVLIVLTSWALHNYQLYKAKDTSTIKVFPSKRYLAFYLPIGLIIALIALLAFALLQTQSNYKYVHSLWHIMMAIAVVILLPIADVFIPKPDINTANNSY